ncbi:hypothetical protein Rs2_27101 [Raphanus sativus]|nr:hypothetical protein Rs2_27101 [Raphanus sativus]
MESSFFYLKTKTQKPQVPALQRFLQSRQSHLHQHPDFHITSSTILASTLHITRLNRTTTRNRSPSGGASSEGFNSFLSRFRDTRDEDEAQAFADTSLPNAHHDNLVVD